MGVVISKTRLILTFKNFFFLQELVKMKRLVALILTITLAVFGFDVNDIEQLQDAKKTDHIVFKDIHVPSGQTLNLDKLKPGTLVEFKGIVTFGYEERKGFLVEVSGTNITIRGVPGHIFECQGERWWDGIGGNGGKKKPKFVHVNLIDSVVEGLVVKNTPVHAFAINGSVNVSFSNILLNNADGLVKGGHNTDAFDVYNSKNIKISNCTVENQDDCLAVNAGDGIIFENNVCIGGHGISIGSVGGRQFNEVRNVLMRNCHVADSTNGIRIKTNRHTFGTVHNVTFDNIRLVDISDHGIIIHGNYKNMGTGGEPTPGVPITGLTIKHIHGNVLPQGTNVYINVANASDWTVEDVQITGGARKLKCQGIPPGTNISCEN